MQNKSKFNCTIGIFKVLLRSLHSITMLVIAKLSTEGLLYKNLQVIYMGSKNLLVCLFPKITLTWRDFKLWMDHGHHSKNCFVESTCFFVCTLKANRQKTSHFRFFAISFAHSMIQKASQKRNRQWKKGRG